MIRQDYAAELADLDREIMKMGLIVEKAISKAVQALKELDEDLAQEVIDDDSIVDAIEKDLCDRCALIIARQQPVAGDLRRLIGGIKIITDLERIGDHAGHVAKGAIRMPGGRMIKPLVDIPRMGELCCKMLSGAVKAFIEDDVQAAKQIAAEDDLVDDLHKQVIREVLTYMMSDTKNIEGGLELMHVSRFIERIGDHVCNICEWVIFSDSGEHIDL